MHTRALCAGGPGRPNEHVRTSCGYCTQLPNSHQPNGHQPTVAQTGDDSWLGTGDGHPPDPGLEEKRPNPTTQTVQSRAFLQLCRCNQPPAVPFGPQTVHTPPLSTDDNPSDTENFQICRQQQSSTRHTAAERSQHPPENGTMTHGGASR